MQIVVWCALVLFGSENPMEPFSYLLVLDWGRDEILQSSDVSIKPGNTEWLSSPSEQFWIWSKLKLALDLCVWPVSLYGAFRRKLEDCYSFMPLHALALFQPYTTRVKLPGRHGMSAQRPPMSSPS